MGILTVFHHVGTFFLFAASILLLITTITAPVVTNLAMLRVDYGDVATINFGTFGYCVVSNGQSQSVSGFFSGTNSGCSSRQVGYDIAKYTEALDNADYGSAAVNTADSLTRVQVIHPIVCGLAFISFLFAAGAGICGSLFAFAFAAITWILTLVVMVTDFIAFGIVRDHVNGDDSLSTARFGAGMWTELAAFLLLFFGMFIVLFSCCANRRSKRNASAGKHESYAAGPVPTASRRRFWQRSPRY